MIEFPFIMGFFATHHMVSLEDFLFHWLNILILYVDSVDCRWHWQPNPVFAMYVSCSSGLGINILSNPSHNFTYSILHVALTINRNSTGSLINVGD